MMKHFAKSIVASVAVVFLSLLIFSLTYSSDKEAVELLKKTYANQLLVSHTGTLNTVVFLGDEKFTSTVEIRQKDGKMRMDYKESSLLGLSIIDDGKRVMRIDNKNHTVAIRPIRFAADDNISLLLSNYEVRKKGTEKIADRQTEVLQILPKREGNPGKKLWIDKETFMPLRREHYNSDGVLTTLTFYTQINYDTKIKNSDFEPPKDFRIVEPRRKMQKYSKERISEIVGFDIVEPKYVPSGYVLDGFYLFGKLGKDVHIRYVDGLNTISVFEGPSLPSRRDKDGLPRRPPNEVNGMRGRNKPKGKRPGSQVRARFLDNRRGRTIEIVKGDLNVVLVADIAEAEFQKISDSF
jgi:outer membrane lipoprotein-sorting protein